MSKSNECSCCEEFQPFRAAAWNYVIPTAGAKGHVSQHAGESYELLSSLQ